MGQARAAEAPLKGISGGPIWEAEADVELLSPNYDAPFTVERFKLLALVAEASGRQLETRHKSVEMLRVSATRGAKGRGTGFPRRSPS
jgi:hypothetical protein